MSANIEALRPWRVARVARSLELHPFEVIRILVTCGGVPPSLRLHPSDVARVVEGGGLEAWWEGDTWADDPETRSELLVALASELLEREVVEPGWTRSDNLFRGLAERPSALVRRVVNAWIRSGTMGSRMTQRGLEVTVRAEGLAEVRSVAAGDPFAISALTADI